MDEDGRKKGEAKQKSDVSGGERVGTPKIGTEQGAVRIRGLVQDSGRIY